MCWSNAHSVVELNNKNIVNIKFLFILGLLS